MMAFFMFGEIWSSGTFVRFSVYTLAISLPSAARILVVWLGGSTFSSAGRESKKSMEPLAALPETAAAGTSRPATRTPQIALTPRKRRILPSVVAVSNKGLLRVAMFSTLPARATLSLMTKWEYATIPLIIHATKQILDQWGEDGWELVQVVPGPDGNGLVAYLKREKQ
ncbi:conserved hypothetical protein [Arthrobacter sp. 8AJ]|nr:conserved hypothetical protein [Arthrobacter sp. 8AJ]